MRLGPSTEAVEWATKADIQQTGDQSSGSGSTKSTGCGRHPTLGSLGGGNAKEKKGP